MTRTNNLFNTQFRYQIVFFIYIHGYIWLAEGCLWHLFPRQTCCWHLLTGGMILLIQRDHFSTNRIIFHETNQLLLLSTVNQTKDKQDKLFLLIRCIGLKWLMGF